MCTRIELKRTENVAQFNHYVLAIRGIATWKMYLPSGTINLIYILFDVYDTAGIDESTM